MTALRRTGSRQARGCYSMASAMFETIAPKPGPKGTETSIKSTGAATASGGTVAQPTH